MTRIHLDIPDELLETARARAADAGFPTVEAYANAWFQDELRIADESLEQLLLERLNSSEQPVEATSEFWVRLQAKIDAQYELPKV